MEDVQRAPAVGAEIWCLYACLSCSEAGALLVRGWHILNRCCVAVYGSILIVYNFNSIDFPFRCTR